jgi:hypothetical protein
VKIVNIVNLRESLHSYREQERWIPTVQEYSNFSFEVPQVGLQQSNRKEVSAAAASRIEERKTQDPSLREALRKK